MALFKPRLWNYPVNLAKLKKEERKNERGFRKERRRKERTKRGINNETNKREAKEETGEVNKGRLSRPNNGAQK
jgi:hypothetical protein